MSRQSRLISWCAGLGLAISVLIFLYMYFVGQFDATLYTGFAVICPPSLLCIPFSEALKTKSGLAVVWLFIGITNSGIYAVIGSFLTTLLYRPDS